MTKKFGGGLTGLVLLLMGCGGSSAPTATDTTPIVIGASVSSTGAFAAGSADSLEGYKAAIAAVNKKGGVIGRQLKLVSYDDQSDAGTVVKLYNKLLTEDKVNVLLSPYSSSLGGPAAQLADKYKIPMIHTSSTSVAIFANTQYNFQAIAQPSTLFTDVPQMAVTLGVKRLAFLTNALTAVVAICDAAQAKAKSLGLDVVYTESYAAATTDFSSTALKVKQANPDGVFECAVSPADGVGLYRSLYQQGVKPRLTAANMIGVPATRTALGAAAVEGAISYQTWDPALKTTGNAEFLAAYQQSSGKVATPGVAGGYAAVQVIVDAIKTANSSKPEKIAAAMRTVKTKTVLGTYTVTPGGLQIGYGPAIGQVQDGQFVLIFPASVATAKLR